ncbi:MAG: hypothetical protein LAT84_00545 [Balneolia bacterium]|nr:hypothetical protein [Balneolia bacterium]
MQDIKEIVQNIKDVVRRRWLLLLITPLFFVGAAVVALQYIEPKFESSTSILVLKDETLNPLVMYNMGASSANEDRLNSFNEIIYSRTAMEMLIDSLGLDRTLRTESEKQLLISNLRRNIYTTSRASDSFEITYRDTDPVRARDGTSILANHFISSRLRLENRTNEETVTFFSNQLEQLQQTVDELRNQQTDRTSTRLQDIPSDTNAMQARLQNVENQLETVEWDLYRYEDMLTAISNYKEAAMTADGIQYLYRLPVDETPFGSELSELLSEYDTLQQQFTESFPRVRSMAVQIQQLVNRIPPAIESRMSTLESRRAELNEQRGRVVSDMQRFFVATQQAGSSESSLRIYEGLLNDMRVNLEQAKMTRDIGRRGSEQFMVLDAPYIPERPSSPNKRLILSIGLLMGMIMGVGLVSLAEVMDTTIRKEADLPYPKPIIAYLS